MEFREGSEDLGIIRFYLTYSITEVSYRCRFTDIPLNVVLSSSWIGKQLKFWCKPALSWKLCATIVIHFVSWTIWEKNCEISDQYGDSNLICSIIFRSQALRHYLWCNAFSDWNSSMLTFDILRKTISSSFWLPIVLSIHSTCTGHFSSVGTCLLCCLRVGQDFEMSWNGDFAQYFFFIFSISLLQTPIYQIVRVADYTVNCNLCWFALVQTAISIKKTLIFPSYVCGVKISILEHL